MNSYMPWLGDLGLAARSRPFVYVWIGVCCSTRRYIHTYTKDLTQICTTYRHMYMHMDMDMYMYTCMHMCIYIYLGHSLSRRGDRDSELA